MKLFKYVAAGTFACALVGCSQTDSLVATTEVAPVDAAVAETSVVETEANQTSAFALSVGECFNDTADAEIADVPVVECATPHDNEIFHLFDLQGDYPADVTQAGFDGCLAEFENFVGGPFETSIYQVYPMTPTEGSWANGDREVVCSVWIDGEKMTGSAAGTAQ
ncbi:septum formation family protein [Corynebacterium crudilactis]|uniref:Septum formation-related domain-containing protein n=1 Tax=Corynebacterium crudilactis TaxID=1652495 RepID=A0A172QX32_9CORY|nr:septum formation family protein [Corynebacterium crudilactis]ANE05267.1 hypothetical protein ccrud_04125 [Corynebacterium crudilactis]